MSLGMTRGKLDVLRESSMRQFEHALVQKVLVAIQRREDAEYVAGRDAGAGHLTREENTLAEGCVGMDLEVFLVLGMAAGG